MGIVSPSDYHERRLFCCNATATPAADTKRSRSDCFFVMDGTAKSQHAHAVRFLGAATPGTKRVCFSWEWSVGVSDGSGFKDFAPSYVDPAAAVRPTAIVLNPGIWCMGEHCYGANVDECKTHVDVLYNFLLSSQLAERDYARATGKAVTPITFIHHAVTPTQHDRMSGGKPYFSSMTNAYISYINAYNLDKWVNYTTYAAAEGLSLVRYFDIWNLTMSGGDDWALTCVLALRGMMCV